MALETPAWLKQRGCALKLGSDNVTWYVHLNHQPQYLLTPVPVAGKLGCFIKEAVNGKRVESSATWPTPDEALRGGLEDLRKHLGW
jgi:hypothetical protein